MKRLEIMTNLGAVALLTAALAMAGAIPAGADYPGAARPDVGPRLVVVLVHDQFRADYLERFRPCFGGGGFVRLIDGGARFTQCHIPYVPTTTGPGHATLATGAAPDGHGIVGNDWFDRAEGAQVACDEDGRTQPVPQGAARSGSPVRLRAQTVGDGLRGATLGAGKVLGISEKPRAAILSAGHRATAAYWLDEKTGLMQTSSYYMEQLPAWAAAANAARRPEAAAATPWTPLLPARAYRGTDAAAALDEPAFSHALRGPGAPRGTEGLNALTQSPWALARLYEFARGAVIGERLGEDDTPDLLFLSVSVTDRVGHRFGPNSPEVLDLAARADRELARFLDFLDARVGGRYTVVLCADHAAGDMSSRGRGWASASGDSAGAVTDSAFRAWVDGALRDAFGGPGQPAAAAPSFLAGLGDATLWLDPAALATAGVTPAQAAAALSDPARAAPWLAAARTPEQLTRGGALSPVEERLRRGYYPGRSGDLMWALRPYCYAGGADAHGEHGSPYPYDTHVPLVLYGWGVRTGVYRQSVSTTDVAPTVAEILGIDAPAQCEGRALGEALRLPAWR